MRNREFSIPGIASAVLICLVATALTMTDVQRYSSLSLALFSISWLIFYVAMAMPFKIKRKARSK